MVDLGVKVVDTHALVSLCYHFLLAISEAVTFQLEISVVALWQPRWKPSKLLVCLL